LVEVRHCDRCGSRLPVEFMPGEERLCPNCGFPVEDLSAEPAPAGPPAQARPRHKTPLPAARARTRKKTPGGRRGTAVRPQSQRQAPTQRGRAQQPAKSNTAVFIVAAVVGILVAVAVAVVWTGKKPRKRPPVVRRVRPVPKPKPPEPEPEPKPSLDEDFFEKLRKESDARMGK